MSEFNPELWGLRLRKAAGLPTPPPVLSESEAKDVLHEAAWWIAALVGPHEAAEELGRLAAVIRAKAKTTTP